MVVKQSKNNGLVWLPVPVCVLLSFVFSSLLKALPPSLLSSPFNTLTHTHTTYTFQMGNNQKITRKTHHHHLAKAFYSCVLDQCDNPDVEIENRKLDEWMNDCRIFYFFFSSLIWFEFDISEKEHILNIYSITNLYEFVV